MVHLSVKRGDGERDGTVYEQVGSTFVLYQPDDLRAMVEAAGFEIESVRADELVQLLARA